MEIHLPIDCESRADFRRLESALGPGDARAVFLRLWVELGQLARATRRVGMLPLNAVGLFAQTLPWIPEPKIMAALAPTVEGPFNGQEHLFLLRPEAEGYFCPAFAELNRHCAPDFVAIPMRGAGARANNYNKKRASVAAQQESLFVDPAILLRPNGEPLEPGEVNRVLMLIKLLDGYLRIERSPKAITAGLVQDAYRALLKHGLAESGEKSGVDRVCEWIYHHRDKEHPALPKTTEQVLRDFDRLAESL